MDNAKGWEAALGSIFGARIPQEHEWTDRSKICWIISQLGAPNLSYMLIPTGASVEFTSACPAGEDGCIELDHGKDGIDQDCISILRPTRLEFRLFDPHLMAYFRLELASLKPAFPSALPRDDVYGCREQVVEVAPGQYKKDTSWQSSDRVSSWRRVDRYIGKGTFTVFAKTSPFFDHVGRPDERTLVASLDSSRFAQQVRKVVKANY
jgi:hypothetical protein